MKQHRTSLKRRIALSVAAAGTVAAALAIVPFAQASTRPAPAAAPHVMLATDAAASTLATAVGDEGAGTYADSSGKMVFAVTTDAAAKKVREAGGTPKMVKHTMAALMSAKSSIDKAPPIVGTSWSVDPATNQVVFSADSSVTGAKLAKAKAFAATMGDTVSFQRVSGKYSTRSTGGDAIFAGGFRCSLGFNVKKGNQHFFLTAGHCGNIKGTWFSDGARTKVLGDVAGSSFPGDDFALIKYTDNNLPAPGHVNLYNGTESDISRAGTAFVGETVTRSGSTTRVHTGRVTAVNASVVYPEGTVSGLIKTTVCAEGGDSGGALFDGTAALGLTSGGSGDCTAGGVTFFQPVAEPLGVFGVSIY